MRHAKKFNHLSRKAPHRRALLANLSNALIEHKRITTTVAKAKALRMYFEPLVTKAKTNTTHSRRRVFSKLQNKEAITELFDVIAPKVGDRPGGYVRIIRLGSRAGDGAEMALIELVDFNEVYEGSKTSAGKKTRRGGGRRSRRGSGKSKKAAETTAAASTADDPSTTDEPATTDAGDGADALAEETAETTPEEPAVEEGSDTQDDASTSDETSDDEGSDDAADASESADDDTASDDEETKD